MNRLLASCEEFGREQGAAGVCCSNPCDKVRDVSGSEVKEEARAVVVSDRLGADGTDASEEGHVGLGLAERIGVS